jgi:hypothetical protein
MIIAFAVLLMPLMEAFESQHNITTNRARILSRSFGSLLCVLTGVALPFFGDMVALVAAVAQVYLSFVAPPLFYVAVFGGSLRQTTAGRAKIAFAVLMAVSMIVLGAGFGMYAAVVSLTRNIGTWGVFKKDY